VVAAVLAVALVWAIGIEDASVRIEAVGLVLVLTACALLGLRAGVFGPVADGKTAGIVRYGGCAVVGICLLLLGALRFLLDGPTAMRPDGGWPPSPSPRTLSRLRSPPPEGASFAPPDWPPARASAPASPWCGGWR
jgi:hypothetical protein